MFGRLMTARSILVAALVNGLPAGALAQADAAGAPAVVVYGTVSDAATGEALAGATVYAPALERGVVTDAAGFFSLRHSAGPGLVHVSYVGYAGRAVGFDTRVPLRVDVGLVSVAVLGEVVVEGGSLRLPRPEQSTRMGDVDLRGVDVERLPALLGESDVLRALQLLPGVRGGQEGTAGLYVRGGSPDQTLILLDGTPLYNPSHLFGFLSTFNGDIVDRVELIKGTYPARFGGRLGSVLDVRLREGDLDRHHLQGQVGLIATRVVAEGPLVRRRASFLVSGRRTHVNLLAGPVIERANRAAAERGDAQVEPRAGFFDLNARVHWRPGTSDRVHANLYAGSDAFSFRSTDPAVACDHLGCAPSGEVDLYGGSLDWRNVLGSVRYARVLSRRAMAEVTLSASDYDFRVGIDVEEGLHGPAPRSARARYRSGVRDLGVRLEMQLAPGDGHALGLGGSLTRHHFTPGALSVIGEADAGTVLDTLRGLNRSTAVDAAAYVEHEWRLGRLVLGTGLRIAYYASGRYRYPSLEPRLSATVSLHDRVAVKVGAGLTQQPIHLLTTGAGVGLPADLWMPADSVGPERAWQMALGLAGSLPNGLTTWTVEGYWREMDGLVSYRDGASFATPFNDWQELIVTGEGSSRGVELLLQHRQDRLTAWVGYTLARSDRRFEALDGGAPFPFRYDRRHDLSAVALVRLSRRIDVSALYVFGTGDAVTLPVARFDATYLNARSVDHWTESNAFSAEETAYGPRNRFRLPNYSRVDIGATLYFRRSPRPHSLSLNVYNVTNRKNPFVTTLDSRVDERTGERRRQLVGVALFPILPTLSYEFSF